MKPEDQRIAIAEFCGWTKVRLVDCGNPLGVPPSDVSSKPIPDYLSDLNAIAEAESKLEEDLRSVYESIVSDLSTEPGDMGWGCLTASASVRAEALLKTIGKWRYEE